ncbi:hypothetical protein H9X77_16825, partial [Clostridium saudiense]|nr:hypothetical protein [Clostridium saudiense]
NIWFYYSPDTNVGYKYKDGIWTNANEVKHDTDNSANSENIVDEKPKMLEKAYKFFADRGIEIDSSGYSEMLGTNLNSGINELEGHRVFAFTIKNYDIVNNNIVCLNNM